LDITWHLLLWQAANDLTRSTLKQGIGGGSVQIQLIQIDYHLSLADKWQSDPLNRSSHQQFNIDPLKGRERRPNFAIPKHKKPVVKHHPVRHSQNRK
jgi:hypothetical protein